MRFNLGTIPHPTAAVLFFCPILSQDTDYSVLIDGEDKLLSFEPAYISGMRRKEQEDPLNMI